MFEDEETQTQFRVAEDDICSLMAEIRSPNPMAGLVLKECRDLVDI